MIVVVEELVDESVIRADPNRTILPGLVVDAVVVEPFGAHPSYAQGYYDRDNAFYLEWDRISRDEETLQAWLDEWVHGLADRSEYIDKLGRGTAPCTAPNAGAIGIGRLRGVPMSEAAFSASEMMIVAAARELAGQRVCFVGVGLPNIAVNLAQPDGRTGARAGLRGGRVRCPTGAPATVDR